MLPDKSTEAWRMTCLGRFTRDQITEATGISPRTITTMRSTMGRLRALGLGWNTGRMLGLTWSEARAAAQGRTIRKPTVGRDHLTGKEVFEVTLGGLKGSARIDPADYWRLTDLGAAPNWHLVEHRGKTPRVMARAHLPGTLCTRKYAVAHLLMQPAPNQHVTYRDGDPLNLRRSNLALVNNRKDTMNV